MQGTRFKIKIQVGVVRPSREAWIQDTKTLGQSEVTLNKSLRARLKIREWLMVSG
jgi:hypothetical protein